MSKAPIEAHGSDVEEAIEAGLAQLGLSRKDVIIEIIEEGRKGLLGLGSRDAVVRLTPLSAAGPSATAPEPASPELEPPPAPPAPETEAEAPAPAEEVEPPAPPAAPAPEEPEPASEPEPESPAAAEAVTEPSDVDDEVARVAVEVVDNLLDKMGFEDAEVSINYSEPDDQTGRVMTIVDVRGSDDLKSLIGAQGETLSDLQYLARLMAGHALRRRANFLLDVNGYREKRRQALAKLAERMAEKAVRRGEPVTLEPMSAYDRRLVHVALRDHADVYTSSVGEGASRRVRIYLTQEGE